MQKMSLTRASAAMWLLICLSSGALRAAPPEGYNFLPLSDAARQASAENKPMLLYFGRYGCTTCRKMHAEVFSDAAVSKKYNGEFVLAYVDTESGNRIRLANGETTTEMQFAARSRILGTPTFIYFSPEQKPLFKKAGFQSIEQMKRYLDFVARGHYRTMSLQDYLASL
jgi:thioredoxin-related protein